MVDTESLYLWSTTAASNDTADGGINWQEGQTPGSVNASARSMMAALAKFLADTNGTKTTAGSANAYTLASPATAHSSLLNGLIVRIKASFTNTGAATFNLSSIGAKKILLPDATGDLAAGQLQANGHYTLEYDTAADSSNGAWLCLNPGVKSGVVEEWAGSTLPNGYLWCDGSSYLRTTYPGLFGAISTQFGAADGTHFNVPDRRGRTGFGKDDMGGSAAGRLTLVISGTVLGAAGGADGHTLTTPELPVVTPAGTIGSTTSTGTINGDGTVLTVSITDPGHVHATSSGGGNFTTASLPIGTGVAHSFWVSDAGGGAVTSSVITNITAAINVNSINPHLSIAMNSHN